MIVLCWLKWPQFVPKIAAIEQLFLGNMLLRCATSCIRAVVLTSKQIETILSQPKLNQTYSEVP